MRLPWRCAQTPTTAHTHTHPHTQTHTCTRTLTSTYAQGHLLFLSLSLLFLMLVLANEKVPVRVGECSSKCVCECACTCVCERERERLMASGHFLSEHRINVGPSSLLKKKCWPATKLVQTCFFPVYKRFLRLAPFRENTHEINSYLVHNLNIA